MKKFLIISPFSTHKTNFHFKNIIPIFNGLGVDCKIIDSHQFITRYFDLKKYWKKKQFDKILDEYNPDIILLDGYNELVYPIVQRRIPFFFLIRGHIWKEEKWSKETINKSLKQKLAIKRKHRMLIECCEKSTGIVVISNFLKKVVEKHTLNKKIEVIHLDARDPDFWKKQKGMQLKHPCIGLLQGAGIWGKAKEMLVLPEIIKEMPNLNFYWAGDGIYKEEILSNLKKFKNFHWLGNLSYPEKVKEFLSEIDIYLMLSGMDGLGQSIIEASLMEKPIIATNVGGISETIQNGKTGFLVEIGDVNNIIKKISIIHEDKKLSEYLGRNARDFAREKFNWEKIAMQLFEFLQNTTNHKN